MFEQNPYLHQYINAWWFLYKIQIDEDISPEETDVERKEVGKGQGKKKTKLLSQKESQRKTSQLYIKSLLLKLSKQTNFY